MGRRGPPKKPTALKIAQGQRKRDLPKDELSVPHEDNPEMKFELSDRGQMLFEDVCKRLNQSGMITILDVQTITRYCDVFDKWLHYRDMVTKSPMVKVKTPMGERIEQNPALNAYMNLARELLKLEQQFGMTPSARASIGAVKKPADEKSPEEKLNSALYGDE